VAWSEKERVYLERADSLVFHKAQAPDAQVLRGNVAFRQGGAWMYCDSAYFYETGNSLEAFGNVHMEQGDTIHLYGRYLHYDGDSRLARLRQAVKLVHTDVTVNAAGLNYDLTAERAVFRDSVHLYTTDFTLLSDTLLYHPPTKEATILGPSRILTDSATVYTQRGQYHTELNRGYFLDRSLVVSGGRTLIADSIYFDRPNTIGEGFGCVEICDSSACVTLTGDYGYHNDGAKRSFVSRRACLLEYSNGDTLYLHADTILTLGIDSTRITLAYHGVRFYRSDIQGTTDSLSFTAADSTLRMYINPRLWQDQLQLSGDTIDLLFGDTTLRYAHIRPSAFAIQQVSCPPDTFYNQLKGADMQVYFLNSTDRRIDLSGNAESIYYPPESDSTYLNLNHTRSGELSIHVYSGRMERLVVRSSPQGTLTPIPLVPPKENELPDFMPLFFPPYRPLSPEDVFLR
jgi:lipopolysaccharide export system protein LptA